MADKVPLVVYKDGKRIVIGEAEVEEDGSIKANITDHEMAETLGVSEVGVFSIGHEHEALSDFSLEPPFKRRNVFDQNKDR